MALAPHHSAPLYQRRGAAGLCGTAAAVRAKFHPRHVASHLAGNWRQGTASASEGGDEPAEWPNAASLRRDGATPAACSALGIACNAASTSSFVPGKPPPSWSRLRYSHSTATCDIIRPDSSSIYNRYEWSSCAVAPDPARLTEVLGQRVGPGVVHAVLVLPVASVENERDRRVCWRRWAEVEPNELLAVLSVLVVAGNCFGHCSSVSYSRVSGRPYDAAC